MPKSLFVDPGELLARGQIHFEDIPVNAYASDDDAERRRFGDAALRQIYADMVFIREFETMLHRLKTEGAYEGIAFFYAGPAHLSIGQEAAAVGEAYLLGEDDFIFGSHRSHGEFLAKGFSLIRRLPEARLWEIMEECNGGLNWRVMRENGLTRGDVRATAKRFLAFSLLSEMLAKETGFNHGLGGSMHAFCLPFGIYPNNAIVGGQADIAAGAALYKRIRRKDGVVIANLGDGSSTCGNVWEAMNFAAMDQFFTLWPEDCRGGLPILFNFVNNQYSMGDQPRGETTGMRELARMGAAVNPDAMYAVRIDGNDPLAVIDAMERSLEILRAGRGPVLHDVITYRFCGHSPSDPFSYRTPEEVRAWEEWDPIRRFEKKLTRMGILDSHDTQSVREEVLDLLREVCRVACDDRACGRLDLNTEPDRIANLMFSNTRAPREPAGCELTIPISETARARAIRTKDRGVHPRGETVRKNRVFQLRDGIYEALMDGFASYPDLIAYGEGCRDWGGAFAVYRGMAEALPCHRLFNAPIAEGAIVSTAVGYAMAGGRAVVELMYFDFLGRAADQVFNQLSKWQEMSACQLKMPVVVRTSVGSKYGAQHSQDWTSLVAHIPGLKVVYPATPYDAKGLMNAALAGSDPVIFIESQKLYDVHEQFHPGGVPEGYYEIELGEPDVKRSGGDLTILSVGAALYRALEAADRLEKEFGVRCEVIDARSIVPFHYEKVLASVKKTGRIVIVGDMCERGSVLCDFAKNIAELAFDDLDAPPMTVGARNWAAPAFEFERYFYPQAEWILDAVHEKVLPLPGYVSARSYSSSARLDAAARGV